MKNKLIKIFFVFNILNIFINKLDDSSILKNYFNNTIQQHKDEKIQKIKINKPGNLSLLFYLNSIEYFNSVINDKKNKFKNEINQQEIINKNKNFNLFNKIYKNYLNLFKINPKL